MADLNLATQSKKISSVVALVRDANGRVALASFSESGPWSCIGGGLAEGEDPADGAARFAMDDCGIEIEVGETIAHLAGEKYRILYECGADVTYEASVLEARAIGFREGAPMRWMWFTSEDLAATDLDSFAETALPDLGLR